MVNAQLSMPDKKQESMINDNLGMLFFKLIIAN